MPPVDHQRFEVVVAADLDGGIGLNGDLPWKLPGDMRFFRELTTGGTVIMGRKTWDSIPARFRPLRQRQNIVVSRNAKLALPEGVMLATSFDLSLERAERERVFVIGGAAIYALALVHPGCHRVHLTRVDARFECDTFLPALDGLTCEARSERHEEGGVGYAFERWKPTPTVDPAGGPCQTAG